MEHSSSLYTQQEERLYTDKLLPFETQFQELDLKNHTRHYADNLTQRLYAYLLNLEALFLLLLEPLQAERVDRGTSLHSPKIDHCDTYKIEILLLLPQIKFLELNRV